MSSSSSNQIQITHIINAHLFWFKYVDQPDLNAAKIEAELRKYVDEHGEDVYADQSKKDYRDEEIVAVYLRSKKKWIRAEVDVTDEPADENVLIVWATDYGIPVKTSLDSVILLSPELKKICEKTPTNIVQGGICNIMPGSSKINSSNKTRVLQDRKWDPKVMEIMEKTKLYASVRLHFERKFDTNNHVFGDLKMRKDDVDERSFGEIVVKSLNLGVIVSSPTFIREIAVSDTVKMDRWLDNNGDLNCIKNFVENDKKSSVSTPGVYDFKPRPTIASPISETSNFPTTSSPETSNSSTKGKDEKEVKNESRDQPEIDQLKMLQKFTRMQLLSTVQNVPKSEKPIETASSLNSVQSVEKVLPKLDKPKQSTYSTLSKTSTLSMQCHAQSSTTSKPLNQSKTLLQSRQPQSPAPALITQSSPLTQIDEPGLFNKIKSIPIFVRNNVEEPIDSINLAQFTSAVHRGMRKMNLQETYLLQGYAWPNLLRGNSMVLIDSQNRGKTMTYLPAVCSLVQREFDNAEAEKGERNRPQSKMGATAIIVCLTSNVKKIAEDCRTILQMPTFKSNVIEATVSEAVSVMVKLFNGCNILVVTAPCLMNLIANSPAMKSDRLKCIAFENLDCIMDKHPETINYIIKNLCSRKSYKGDMRQCIVTSRTWRSSFLKFLNEKDVTDGVLVIGNQLEAAFCAGVLMHFRLCKLEVKLDILVEHIGSLPYQTERTMVICNDSSEAEQVKNHFESKKIPNELVTEIESNYAQAKVKSFWDKIEGILICTDAHLHGLQIKNVQHVLHFSVPTQNFRSFLTRHSTFLDFYAEGKNKQKATSTIFFDDNNFRQLPKLVELLTRDGQEVPSQVLELSQKARMINIREKAEKQRYESICNFIFMHGISEHQANCRYRHLLLPFDKLEDSEQITSGHLRFKVLKNISPTEYIIQPTNHSTGQGAKWQIINNSDEFDDLNSQMQAYYKEKTNQKVLHILELGQKCVVALHELYYRAEIIAIIEKRKITDVDIYEVRFLDTGDVEQRHAVELYTLDEQFQALPNQAYHLHLTSIVPADREDDWDPRVCEEIATYLNKLSEKQDDSIYEANIVFALRNTIVVDIMRLIGLNHGIVHCAIKKYLQRRNYGIPSTINRNKVIEMAKAAGIKVKPNLLAQSVEQTKSSIQLDSELTKSDRSKSKVKDEIESSISARVESNADLISFDDSNSESVSHDDNNDKWESPWKVQHKNVYISQFYSPNDFYVVHKSDKLLAMYEAINEYIENSLNDSMGCPDVHKYCLVQGKDGYDRAKVIEISYGEDIQLKVFLVDTGYAKTVDITNVYDIPDNLIQMLPFQAIWCNLIGIKPIENAEGVAKWNENQIDEIYDLIDEYGTELFLHTVSTDKSIKSKIPDTKYLRHDIVLLALPDQEQQIDINKMIVAHELAEFDSNTKHHLENVPMLLNTDDSDSESDWEEECKANENKQNKWVMVNNDPPSGITSPESDTGFEDFQALLNDESFIQDADDFIRNLFNVGKENQSTAVESEMKTDNRLDTILESEIETEVKTKSEPPAKRSVYDQNIKLDNGYASTSPNDSNEGSENTIESQSENSSEDSVNPIDRHQLEYIYKRPRVYWWQNEEKIVLKISAHDNVKYGLDITSDQFIYGTVENGEQIVAIIHFFGHVDHEVTTHEVRGLNVVIRLRKQCPIMWPRLLRTAQKCTWLIQNIDAINDEEYYDRAIAEFNKFKPDSDSDDEFEDHIEPPSANLDLEDDDQSEGASF